MAYAFDHDRYCAEITRQATLFKAALAVVGTPGLDTRVPTCPDWTLRDLTTHVGGSHRTYAELVRTRATEMVGPGSVPGASGPGDGAPAEELDAWFGEGVLLLTEELRAAGPDARVWTWAEQQNAAFWARRAVHETAVHRADACIAAGVDFTLAPEVAADCLDEWLEFVTTPLVRAHKPELKALAARAGSTLHVHATDVAGTDTAGGPAEWLIELGEDGIGWRRAHEKATVALRGPLTDVLLVIHRRLPADSSRVEVLGEAELLDLWLEKVRFG